MTVRIEYDDDQLAIVDKVNTALKSHGLALVDDNLEHDGYCLFALQTTAAPASPDAALRKALGEALDLFDAVWCTEWGHQPKPEQIARASELRKLVAP